jgi:DUF1680 family protein
MTPYALSRRSVLAAGSALAFTAGTQGPALAGAAAIAVRPFAAGRVKLTDGPFKTATEGNRGRLMAQDPDRLLHTFRLTAGLPSTAQPLAGWERPDCELRGHFTGHFLSACALMSAHHGDEALKAKGQAIVAALAECQKANGGGYLSAYPANFFERLKQRDHVWAPFYTQHKILAGLIEMARLTGDEQAKTVAAGMGDWTIGWLEPIDDAHLQDILETEFGGMSEALFDLQVLTGDERYGAAARRFEKRKFLDPLAEGRDELTGLHANTHIPQAISAARRYELSGEGRYRDIADYFWTEVVDHRTFATGGTSSGETWRKPKGQMAAELGAYTCECCCSYNMLRLSRHRFGWSPDARIADYEERTLFNAILGTQYAKDGMMMYYVPMQSGWWKQFSDGDGGFWCCDGSGIESFSKLGDSVYFEGGDTLYVNQFVASELDWAERGLKVVQETRFPDESTTRVTFRTPKLQKLAVKLRIPTWAKGATVRMSNGGMGPLGPVPHPVEPGQYVTIDREWGDGSWVELNLPMALRLEPISGDDGLKAVMYGPLVLAGRLGADGLGADPIHAPPTRPRTVPEFPGKPAPAPAFRATGSGPADWIKPVEGRSLVFRTAGQTTDVEFVPFNRLYGERYGIYWKVA